jgi:hypothetical protein
MPSHTHTQNAHDHFGSWGQTFVAGGGISVVAVLPGQSANYTIGATTATNQNTGGGGAHNNLQPYQVLNYIIKASAGTTAGDSELATRLGAVELGKANLTGGNTFTGTIRMTTQPSFRAFVNTSVSYGTTWQKIQITNEVHDNAGNYDAANSRFTAPVAGVYLFTTSVVTNHEGDGTLAIAINGSYNNYITTSMTGSGSFQGPSVSAAVKLAANDYVEVWRYFSSSVTTRGPQWSGYFSGHLLG